MPEVRRKTTDTPTGLRPYAFHGLSLAVRNGQGVGDCPFCGKSGKFSVNCETTQWRCFSCSGGQESGGGNARDFVRLLHAAALRQWVGRRTFFAEVAADRGFVRPATVGDWGVWKAADGCWIVPGYHRYRDGRVDLHQLYRRTLLSNNGDWSWRLLPTDSLHPAGEAHALHLPFLDFEPERPNIYICEGVWDGMALWETWQDRPKDTNIIAVPGCNVWRDEWTQLCRGKNVTLLLDSDHPRELLGGLVSKPGYDGTRRIAKKLSGVAASTRYLCWGPDGYDPAKPSGWDVRDELTSATDRRAALQSLFLKIVEVPVEWVFGTPLTNGHSSGRVHTGKTETLPCTSFAECETAWKDALRWREEMGDALAVLLAVCASTQQSGNQLFLQLIGSAGSGKTTLCDGLLTSRWCFHLEHLTGFVSGYRKKKPKAKGKRKEETKEEETKEQSREEEDTVECSLVERINGKTLVTPEADLLVSSPRFAEIMAQQRRLFDGKIGATYRNTDQDRLWAGLRTPWIMAGTPAMMDHDQSHLGDRFLRFIINDPPDDERRAILRRAVKSERVALVDSANGSAASIVDPKTRLAHAITGGYVDWLRANIESRLVTVRVSDHIEDLCIDLAELSANLRARPQGEGWGDKRKQEPHDCKELPTRLARQNVRLASCLAVVLGKQEVDTDVVRIIRKVALDTASGHSLNLVRWLCSIDYKRGKTRQECGGIPTEQITSWASMTEERLLKYLLFLRKIGVVEMRQQRGLDYWLLTERVYDLYLRVVGS